MKMIVCVFRGQFQLEFSLYYSMFQKRLFEKDEDYPSSVFYIVAMLIGRHKIRTNIPQ